MSLKAPKLDDRHFQDIVDEAKKKIPHYSKEWTDHNVSDPGVTLIELFAWMTDMILYRLNRVPERHYIKFMEMLGIQLKEPEPARVPLTFWLSAPQDTAVTIPAGTEVATTQTETEVSTIFTTDKDFVVEPPELVQVMKYTATEAGERSADAYEEVNLRRFVQGLGTVTAFSTQPQPRDGLYFGFDNDLSHHVLEFTFSCADSGGALSDATLPPYLWEAAMLDPDTGIHWEPCDVEFDLTVGLNQNGEMRIHLPKLDRRNVGKAGELFWVRLRIRDADEYVEGMQPYLDSPQLTQVDVKSWGGTVQGTHSQMVMGEVLGISDGSAGQEYQLNVFPILPREAGETLLVERPYEEPEEPEEKPEQFHERLESWVEVKDFADSGQDDRHFTLDSITGVLRLGPAIRQQDGQIRRYGKIPPRNATLRFNRYRHGGGREGNVARDKLNTLKTSIPFIASVRNRVRAEGGLDAELLEDAMVRAPALLRTRERAVTEADFEFFAREALQAEVGRVKCLQPRPSDAGRVAAGQIYVLVIPRVLDAAGRLQSWYIPPDDLEPAPESLNRLREDLDKRRLLTTRLDIRAPAYRWVAARVQCRANPDVEQEEVEQMIVGQLYKFLNPLTGGPDGQGWPFGRELFVSDVYQCLQGLPNIQFIRRVEIFTTTAGGYIQGTPVETVEVVGHGTVASGRHEVEFV